MFCEKCGAKIEDNARFCSNCGGVIANINNASVIESNTVRMNNSFDTQRKTKKTIWIIVSIVLTIAIVFSLFLFFDGGTKNTLLKGTWYYVRFDDNNSFYPKYARRMIFHSNGRCEIYYYEYWATQDRWVNTNCNNYEWELLDDKELCFDGDYYSYSNEKNSNTWSVSSGNLVIGKDEYQLRDDWDIEKSE